MFYIFWKNVYFLFLGCSFLLKSNDLSTLIFSFDISASEKCVLKTLTPVIDLFNSIGYHLTYLEPVLLNVCSWLLYLLVLFFLLLYVMSFFVTYDAFGTEFYILSINIFASALFLFTFALYLFLSYYNICVLFNFSVVNFFLLKWVRKYWSQASASASPG